MNEELLVLTHNDLDALGCMLNIEYATPNIKKKYWYTNYSNIPEIVSDVESYILANDNTHLIITDVSFSDNKEYLKKLYDLPVKITYIDHHLYPDDFFEEFPNMKVTWNKDKSATLLCNEFFKNDHDNLRKLSQLIDVYDLWQVKHPAFGNSQNLNDYFWRHDIYDLCMGIKQRDYNLPENYFEYVQSILDECERDIAEYENHNKIHRAGEITFVFVDNWFNQILISEMKKGKNFVIGMTSYGIIRVRINEDAPYSLEQKLALRKELAGTEDTGHLNAFTYKETKATTLAGVMNEVKRIANAIEKYCE